MSKGESESSLRLRSPQTLGRAQRQGACFGLILIFGMMPSWGGWAREDIVPGSFYTSAEDAAMGGAAAPFANDPASALFDNPAAIPKLSGFQAEPLNFTLYSGANFISQTGSSPLSLYKVTSLSSYLPTLQNNVGSYTSIGGSFTPSFYYKGFVFGLLAQSQLGAVANSDGTVSYRSLYQIIPAVGTGIKLAGGIVRIGYSLQWVNQASGAVSEANPSATPLGYNQQLQQGSFLSHNIGFSLTLPYTYLPQLNVVGRNLFNTGFGSHSLYQFTPDSTGVPTQDPATIDVGLALTDRLGGGSSLKFSVVDRDASDQCQVSILGRVAAGAEWSFKDFFLLRAGWGSGYPDLGFGIKVPKAEISFAWASEEIGTSYHGDRDIHYLLQFQIRAF